MHDQCSAKWVYTQCKEANFFLTLLESISEISSQNTALCVFEYGNNKASSKLIFDQISCSTKTEGDSAQPKKSSLKLPCVGRM